MANQTIDIESYISQAKDILSGVGDSLSDSFSKILEKLLTLGLNLSVLSIKILAMIVLGFFLYVVLKFAGWLKKPVKIVLTILIIILILSLFFSF